MWRWVSNGVVDVPWGQGARPAATAGHAKARVDTHAGVWWGFCRVWVGWVGGGGWGWWRWVVSREGGPKETRKRATGTCQGPLGHTHTHKTPTYAHTRRQRVVWVCRLWVCGCMWVAGCLPLLPPSLACMCGDGTVLTFPLYWPEPEEEPWSWAMAEARRARVRVRDFIILVEGRVGGGGVGLGWSVGGRMSRRGRVRKGIVRVSVGGGGREG